MTTVWSALLLIACLVIGVRPSLAQFGSASVLGYVRDNTGAMVPGAIVTLTNVSTNVSQTAQTDKEGKYEFNSVPVGNYQIATQAAAFQGSKTDTFNLSTDARQLVDVDVKPGAVSQVIEVTAGSVAGDRDKLPKPDHRTERGGESLAERQVLC